MKYFKIIALEKWQHYKDRRPPWIKLHSEILDDYKFTNLKDKEKCHLMLLWLLASQCDNRLPYDNKWIERKLSLTDKIDLKLLESLCFIEVEQDASNTIAESKQSANAETEAETKSEAKAKTYGEFGKVKLSDEELGKVKDIYAGNWEEAIDLLDSYIASKGDKYKSHYAVLGKSNWVFKQVGKEKEFKL